MNRHWPFSGTVTDPDTGFEFTESKMNGYPEAQTADRFSGEAHRILVVAEKFQTGFDQPLLHTMFVDKQLEGVNAVQTLSRLNRIHPGKEDTFVLDFVNDADQIQKGFAPFYDVSLAAPTDPNELWDSWADVEPFGVILPEDVEAFAAVYFVADPGDKAVQAKLYSLLDPARDRFADLETSDREEFRTAVKRFVARYGFISQVIPMTDTTMEKRYALSRLLLKRLPARPAGTLDLGDDVELTHLRIARTGEHDLSLEQGGGVLHAFGQGAPGGYDSLLEPLSSVIKRFNEAFGINLTEADRLHLEGIVADLAADPTMQRQAAANTQDTFGLEFDEQFMKAVAARLSKAEALTIKILDDKEFQDQIAAALLPRVYEQARVAFQKTCPIGELLLRDEDQHLEFKSTLRWDLKKAEKSKLVESAVIKTVAAFLNSRYGGTLVIGVGDGPDIVGLEHDYATVHREGKAERDLFLLHLNQVIENAVGLAAAANVTTTIHTVDGRDVCRVHVEPSGHPIWAKVTVADKQGQVTKKQPFYIRLNNGTRAIEKDDEVERYVAHRWGQDGGSLG